jgi:RNA polymerase sigma-70 factor (ECF subfamily)
MNDPDAILPELRDARARFDELVRELRPDLHRYCARMTGSVIDGEDVVQDALARAYFSLGELASLESLRPWLFRIAHHRALDFRRRYDQRMSEPFDDAPGEGDPEASAAAADVARTSFALFLLLPPSQRSAVILKDVLGHSTAEIAELLGFSVAAVEACLHRGRSRLRAMKPLEEPARDPLHPAVLRYAELFGARDFDGIRAMLAEDVRLDLVGHSQRTGRAAVGRYYQNYATLRPFRVTPGRFEGRPVLAFFAEMRDETPAYVIELTVEDGAIASIRDYRYVPYLVSEAVVASHPTHSLRRALG